MRRTDPRHSRLVWPLLVGLLAHTLPAAEPAADSSPAPGVGWRADGSGHYPDADPPLAAEPRHRVWQTALPNWSNASPTPVGDRLFVCSEPTTLICVAEADGTILWRRDAEVVDNLLTPEELARYLPVRARLDAIERERTALLVAQSRAAAAALPNPGERERRGVERRVRLEALEAEQAEITRRFATASFGERAVLSERRAVLRDALRRELDASGPVKGTNAPNPELERRDRQYERERAELTERLAAWSGRLPTPPNQGGMMHADTGYSTPTPASDGRFVYAAFGTGAVACYDLDGGRRWVRDVGDPVATCGQVASPLLAGGKLVVLFAHPTEKTDAANKPGPGLIPGRVPYLIALDAATGEVAWRTMVGAGAGTSVPLRLGAETVLATPAGDVVRAADGKRLAAGGMIVQYNSPAVSGLDLFYVDPQHAKEIVALRLPAAVDEPFAPREIWKVAYRSTRGFATPLCHEGVLYAIGEDCVLTAHDAANGERLYERDFRAEGLRGAYGSVTRAGGHLFIGFESGVLVAFRPGRAYEETGRLKLERMRATPVFRGNRLYVRTLAHLYCLEK
jgi:outer membrane protein assembly factor BamB